MDDEEQIRELLRSPLDSEPPYPGTRRARWRALAVAAGIIALVGTFAVCQPPGTPPATTAAEITAATSPPTTAVRGAATTEPVIEETDTEGLIPRGFTQLASDPLSGKILLLGGQYGVPGVPSADSVWTFDGSSWTEVALSVYVTPISGPAMVGVDSLDGILLFGGGDNLYRYCGMSPCPRSTDSTWLITLDETDATVTPRAPGVRPSARSGHSMAYDSQSDLVVLFGGLGPAAAQFSGGGTFLGDTWIYDPQSDEWTLIELPEGARVPESRWGHQLTYDRVTDLVYLWGGRTSNSRSDPTVWTFDADSATWDTLDIVGESPEPRWFHAFESEPVSGHIVALGGSRIISESTSTGTISREGCSPDQWVLDPINASWRPIDPFSKRPLCHAKAIPTGDGLLLVVLNWTAGILDVSSDSFAEVLTTVSDG